MSNVGPYREMVERYLADTGQTPQPCGAIGGEGERVPKPSKYRNRKTEIDGRVFDSKKEAMRYLDLREQQRAGLIRELVCQLQIPLMVNGKSVGLYVADFVYNRANGEQVIEDVKGMRTDVYKLKRKILAANGITVTEV